MNNEKLNLPTTPEPGSAQEYFETLKGYLNPRNVLVYIEFLEKELPDDKKGVVPQAKKEALLKAMKELEQAYSDLMEQK
ncbi:MAG: hypothetical protein WCT36_04860 [Candidatus Gracilibacteria bacterium]